MDKEIDCTAVLAAFATYGYRKASMEDLARASGVSRQTLYNRFGTKEALLDWAVADFSQRNLQEARACLAETGQPAADALRHAFAWHIGKLVPLLHRAPHAAEVFEIGTALRRRRAPDVDTAFETAVARFLVERGICATQQEATDITFTLTMAAKGLAFRSNGDVDFDTGMARIAAALLARRAGENGR